MGNKTSSPSRRSSGQDGGSMRSLGTGGSSHGARESSFRETALAAAVGNDRHSMLAAAAQERQQGGERRSSALTAAEDGGVGIDPDGDDMSYLQMAKAGYAELVNAIIRPPRARYSIGSLGPRKFKFNGRAFRRSDFELTNPRGMALKCSHWEPDGWRVAEQLPCVVYLHGNSSARPEALPQLALVLSLGATLLAFDCSGSGMSDGEYVSLGYWERDDLGAVIDHLRASGDVGAVALWGRSMGAATALLHGDRDPGIAAMVLDSAFADLTLLANEMVQRGRDAGLAVPRLVANVALRMVRASVARAANFNIKDLCPIEHANRTYIPALFVHAHGDDFIRAHHSQQIHDAYAGDKNLILVDGDHNSQRPDFLHDSIYIFLQNYLQIPLEWALEGTNTSGGMPPWFGAAGWGSQEDPMYYVDDGADMDGDLGFLDGHGRNPERQVEIQAALFQMLAQERSTIAGGAAAAAVTDAASSSPPVAATAKGRAASDVDELLLPPPPLAAVSLRAAGALPPLPLGLMVSSGGGGSGSAAHAGAIAAAARHDCRGVEIIEEFSGRSSSSASASSSGSHAAVAPPQQPGSSSSGGGGTGAATAPPGQPPAVIIAAAAAAAAAPVVATAQAARPAAGLELDLLAAASAAVDGEGEPWECGRCTLINEALCDACEACLVPRRSLGPGVSV